MRIKNLGKIEKIEGKDLYGFFVTKDEFLGKLSSIYCSDGWYDVPIVRYETGESIMSREHLQESSSSQEFDKKVLEGAFVKQSDINVEKQLKDLNIPIRKIRLWNKFGWAFAN